jgi:F-type H+-transporting ATPase subunit epsilon
MPLRLNIITSEHRLYCEDVDMVIAPGVEGQLGILPHHAPLIAALSRGVVRVKCGANEESFAISGGFLEVQPTHVTVLASTVERAKGIDLEPTGAARRRAEGRAGNHTQADVNFARAEAALCREIPRIKVTKLRRRKGGRRVEVRRPYELEGGDFAVHR